MPSLIDAVGAIDVDLVEKCYDVEFVAIDCVEVVVAAVADVLGFVPESDLSAVGHFVQQLAFGFVGSIQPLLDERYAIECACVGDLCDKIL